MEARRNGDSGLNASWADRASDAEGRNAARAPRRGWLRLRRSPLTRKIVTFNLIALNILVAGILYLNASQEGLAGQRAAALVVEAELIADVFEAQLPRDAPVNLAMGDGLDVIRTLAGLDLRSGVDVHVYDLGFTRIGGVRGRDRLPPDETAERPTGITDAVAAAWSWFTGHLSTAPDLSEARLEADTAAVVARSFDGSTVVETGAAVDGSIIFTVASPIQRGGEVLGAVAIVSATGEIDALVRSERERVLHIFIIASIVSIGLSLVLASTISTPLSELADAAELGHDGGRAKSGRVRIPDLTARPDELGRLSGALRDMVNALYDRIDANEQFAADVAHEIKNPLASLRSAVGTMRVAKREDQREKLLAVIEHDVRRLDRLVSDISNASRLDSELVKEEQTEFNLIRMLENLGQFLGEDARSHGIDFIADLPQEAIVVRGLEARLAQVFVNLIANAISFCEEGDAIRVWARRRDTRVLVVVEDTGPGIPQDSLQKIFKRFYSHRPEDDFGNNSGLGLAISKQIVEAHGGVIWAENIRPTEADITSEPLGARFVVGLPV